MMGSEDCRDDRELSPTVFSAETRAMPEPNEQQIQRRYREFLDLMPLTVALAGLPQSEPGKFFTEEQIEARMFTVRHAVKAARTIARETVNR